ncbi:hypothetical protein [Halococcus thailandensis]|nr:hypothetical protein [Halococcus thailandensis]
MTDHITDDTTAEDGRAAGTDPVTRSSDGTTAGRPTPGDPR